MNIALIHLSDFHFKKEDYVITEKVDKIAEAISIAGNIDECTIVFSGDMTFHGAQEEFPKARFTFSRLIKLLKVKYATGYIPLLCVPGNHDLALSDSSRKFNDIAQYYEDGDIERHLEEEFSAMGNYFAEQPSTNRWSDKLICRYFQRYPDYAIQFNLINSAPFSTLKHDDKELHYYPKERLYALRKHPDADICVTVMHHSVEWFEWSCKTDLEKTIFDNSEFLMTGHDHVGSGKNVHFNNDSGVWISAAGSIDFTKIDHEDSFNLIVLNTESVTFDSYLFSWDYQNSVFIHTKLKEGCRIDSRSQHLQPKASFMRELKTDSRRKLSSEFIDYFVFPRLRCRSKQDYTESKLIATYEDFSQHISNYKVCYIDGETNSGKSTLMKYIFLRLCESHIPLIWNVEEEKMPMKHLVKNLFVAQYGEAGALFERYLQSNINERVLLVDNWSSISENDKTSVLSYLCKEFGHVILGRNSSFSSNELNIESDIRESISENNGEYSILQITPFFVIKRTELVKKVCLTSSSLNEDDIEKVNNAINALVANHTSMFTLNPEFIIQYTEYFAREASHSYQNSEKVFSKIFENNITSLIINATVAANVDEYITVLEELAYTMHIQRQETLNIQDITRVIEEYNKDYYASVHPRKFIDAMIKAKILRYIGNTYDLSFCNRNYLSYFIARYIFRDYSNNGNFNDIQDCAKYICFGINADILLFVTYLSSNTKIVGAICSLADALISNWECLDFDKVSLTSLECTPTHMIDSVDAPDSSDHQNYVESIEEREESIHANTNVSTKGIYDYDTAKYESHSNQIKRGIAYTTMIAKALPAFSNIMRGAQKDELISRIYNMPGKILYAILEPIDNEFDVFCEVMYQSAIELNNKGVLKKKYTREDIMQMIRDTIICTILNFEDYIASCAVDIKTSSVLFGKEPENSLQEIQKLIIIENSGNTDKLFREIQNVLKKSSKPHIKMMAKCIMRKHLLCNTQIPYAKKTQIIDKIFGKRARKEFSLPVMNRAM